MDARLAEAIDKYKTLCKDKFAKKVIEKKPNTFSIVYRQGSIKNTHFSGKFTEDISDYFKNKLIEGGIDISDDKLIRTCPLSWTIYFEVFYGLVEIEGFSFTTTDLFVNNRTDLPCEMKIIENIPMCLFDKFNIINYPEWGEVVMFNYDKLKSEMLDKYLNNGSRETLDKSYQDVLDIMTNFPNKYNVLSENSINVILEKPIEITREEGRISNLANTDGFKRLLEEKRAIENNQPDPDEEGVFIIENGIPVNGPNWNNWKRRHDEWTIAKKTWFENLDQDYKLCFDALFLL